jgi:hypothetical protein
MHVCFLIVSERKKSSRPHVRATHSLLEGSSQRIHASFQKPTKAESWHSDGQNEKRLTLGLRSCLEANLS